MWMYGGHSILLTKNFLSSLNNIVAIQVPKGLLQFIDHSTIGNIIISDHAAIFLNLKLQGSLNQSRYWRFNPFIFKDSQFISYFRLEFQSFFCYQFSIYGR